MENPNIIFAVFGLLGYVLVALWKLGASRWNTWFPLLKKLSEFALIGAALGWTVALAASIPQAPNVPTLAVCFLAGLLALPAARLASRRKPEEKTERGARVASAADVTKHAKKAGKATDLALGGVPLLKDNEPYHFMVAGATGSGKSVAIRSLADTLRKRGDTVIMVDSGGEFINRYYDPSRDHILNPFDARCAPWSPLAELDGPWDAQALARSIVPDGVGDSKEWNGYAQTLVTSVLQKMAEQGDHRLGRFLYLVQQAPVAELQRTLVGTPALAQLSSEKTFGSIRTIASNYLLPYGYLTDSNTPFSVSRFVREHKPGFLFLSYRDDQLDSLRNLISAVLDVASRTLLALSPDSDRRIWLIIDEFASIGKVQSIEAVATKARKNGGCLLLGLQSISQIRDRYGEHAAQSILSCLSTWLVLRCTDAETSEYMSKYIGEAQVVRISKSESKNVSGDSDSSSEQRTTERVVLPSEIQALGNLEGFLKVPGGTPVCRLKLGFPPKRDTGTEAFNPRDFKTTPLLNAAVYSPDSKPPGGPQQVLLGGSAQSMAIIEPPRSAASFGATQLNRESTSGHAVTGQSRVARAPGTPASGDVASGHTVPVQRTAAAQSAPVKTKQVPAAAAVHTAARTEPLPPVKKEAPFKSSRLNELLARKRAALAGEPVQVSSAVTDAAARVASAIAQRLMVDARKAQAERATPTQTQPTPAKTRPAHRPGPQPQVLRPTAQALVPHPPTGAAPCSAEIPAGAPAHPVAPGKNAGPGQRSKKNAGSGDAQGDRLPKPGAVVPKPAKLAATAAPESVKQSSGNARRGRRGPGARSRANAREPGFER